jgi:hypothetical protein
MTDNYLYMLLTRHQGPIFQDVDPVLLTITLLLLLIVVLSGCIGGSYCIARARWRDLMELRERHSPSRDQK